MTTPSPAYSVPALESHIQIGTNKIWYMANKDAAACIHESLSHSPEGNDPKLSILQGFQMLFGKLLMSFNALGRENPETARSKQQNKMMACETAAMHLALAKQMRKSWQKAEDEKEEEDAGAEMARH